MAQNSVDQRFAIAHHEAGHAALSLHFGRRFRFVTIVPSGDTLGQLKVGRTSWRPDKNQSASSERIMQHEAMICFAGSIAEAIYVGSVDHGAASRDRDCAINLVGLFCSSERQLNAYIDYLHICAEECFELPAVKVTHEAIVAGLLERNTITYKQAQEIQRQAIAKAAGIA